MRPARSVFHAASCALALLASVWTCPARSDEPAGPEKDFYLWANREWLATAEIAPDKPVVDNFSEMQDVIYDRLKALMEELQAAPSRTDDEGKLVQLYQDYIDMKARNAKGMEPVAADLAAIDALETHEDVARRFAEFQVMGIGTPLVISSETDFKDSSRKIAYAGQAGLGIEREYYLAGDERSLHQKKLYEDFLVRLFELAGVSNSAAGVKDVLDLETKLAAIQWSRVENRNLEKLYNLYSAEAFKDLTRDIHGAAITGVLGLPDVEVLSIMPPSYVEKYVPLFKATPVDAWKSYLKARLLIRYSSLLSNDFKEAVVNYEIRLGLLAEEPPMWRQALDYLTARAGMLLARAYVEKYYDDQDREAANELVLSIRDAYREAISGADWLTAPTKAKALEKLEQMQFEIGHPDKWRDYSAVHVVKGDVAGNDQRLARYEHERDMKKIGQPVDRSDWGHAPHEINAYYDPTKNTFVLLAGILQKPLFSGDAEPAANYGAMGFIIAHEIGHGFDDQGSQFDGAGNMRNWWTDEDTAAYTKVKQALIAQANAYEILPGTFLKGELEIGEIMGDLSGAQIAFEAFKKTRGDQGEDGAEDTRMFFTELARTWRSKWRPEFIRMVLESDPHPPSAFRANGIVRQFDAFYEAFGVKAGDPMYLAPESRVLMW